MVIASNRLSSCCSSVSFCGLTHSYLISYNWASILSGVSSGTNTVLEFSTSNVDGMTFGITRIDGTPRESFPKWNNA